MPNPDPSLEPFAIPEYFADEGNNMRIVNGVFRLTFYSLSGGAEQMSMPVCHLAMPLQSVAIFMAKIVQVLTTATVPVPIVNLSQNASKGDGHSG